MKTRDLNGNIQNWILTGDRLAVGGFKKKSKLHTQAKELIYSLFPTSVILEEVPVKPRNTVQYFDFYINNIKLVIEVNGEQHYKFNTLYHASAQDFLRQRKNDQDKRDWCELNGITLIELPYNEDLQQWEQRILTR